MNRARDWWIQAKADLQHAKYALDGGSYEWACFAAQQAAEKALKAVFEQRGQKSWGHSALRMLQALQDEGLAIPGDSLEAAKILDKHYIPTRYPNSLEQGAPTEFYTQKEAKDAVRYSEEILRFCDHLLR